MRIYFSKAWFLGQKVRKSEPEKDEKFSYFKKKILEHLNSLAKDREELKKSLLVMEKANYPVGTIREWKGKKYIKVAQGKWRPKYDSHSRGAKLSIAALKRKADACKSSEELLQLILENRTRFSDENWRPLPFVKELSNYISAKNDKLESEKTKTVGELKKERAEKKNDVSKIKTATPSGASSDLSSSQTDEGGRNSVGKNNGLKITAREKSTSGVHGETPQSDESLTSTNISQNEEKSSGISDIRKKYESFKSVQGNKKTVTLPNGDKIKCHYKLVEADAPTASHDERTYAPTEGFPKNESGQNINDRDYQNDVDAQISVRNIAANFNSLALESPPIVTKDGIVISGNNRTMSSKLAARNGTDKVYLSDLREMIDEYGLEESDLDGFKNPRLVLEVDEEHKGGYTTEEFAQFNRDTKKTMSNVEKAVKLTKTLNEQKISSIASELSNYDTMGELYADPKGSQAFVSKLIESGIIGDNEKAQYCKSDGTLNDTGKDFVETVLVGSVLNEGNIRNLDGAGGKRIRQKLVRAILPLIENKGNGKEYSFNGELNTAVEIAVNATKEQKTIDDYLAQGSLFDEEKPDEVTSKLAKIIHDEGEKAFAQRMKGLGAGLRDSARGICDIFLGGVESKQSLMEQFLDIKKSMSDFVGRLLKEIA